MSWFKKSIDSTYKTLRDANFYFYFDKEHKPTAEQLELEVLKRGFKTDLRWLDHEDGIWSLTLNKQVKGLAEVRALDIEFESLAEKYKGEYDGHEIEI